MQIIVHALIINAHPKLISHYIPYDAPKFVSTQIDVISRHDTKWCAVIGS